MRQGRKLELLIEEIESLKLPGTKISSPEFVKDIDTGTLREVDIGIRTDVPNGDIFIAVECRDRGSVQDITWIEQLITKKMSVNADVLIAVTSSFTSSAKKKAAKHGVLLRQLNQIKAKEVLNLINSTYVEVHSIERQVSRLEILLKDAAQLENPIDQYNFYLKENNQDIDFNGLLDILADGNIFLKAKDNIPNHGDCIEFSAKLHCSDIFVQASENIEIIAAIIVGAGVKHINKVPLFSGHDYIDPDSDDLLAEVYSYGQGDIAPSKLVVDSESNNAKWHLNFGHLIPIGHVADNIIIKCKNPVHMKSFSISI